MLWILIGYMFLFIHRPFEVWPVLAPFHPERVYALGAVLAAAVSPGKRWLANWQHAAYFTFAAAVLVCWLASPWADAGQVTVENYFKLLVFYVLLVSVVHDERTLKRLLLGFLIVMAVYMAHSLREYLCGRCVFRMGITRMIGVDTSLGNPNSFGASIVFALPFVMPFWVCHRSLALRCFLVGYTALSVVCIGLTGSRSSFVGLLLCALVMILRGRRRLQLALGALLLAPVLWAALPASLQTRFETIINPEVGPANARTSGEGRIQGLLVGLHLWGSNPVTGCGPGCWRAATGRTTESHNLYGQVLGETGSLGALAFAAVVLVLWLNLRRIREAYRLHPDWGPDFLYQVTRAVGLGVLLMLFEGNFGHSLFRYNWVWYGGFLVIAGHCLEQRLQTQAVRRLGRSSSASAFDLRGARGRLVGVISGGIR